MTDPWEWYIYLPILMNGGIFVVGIYGKYDGKHSKHDGKFTHDGCMGMVIPSKINH